MSARDDYPDLAGMDRRLFGFVTYDVELRAALDEIDRLRQPWSEEACNNRLREIASGT